MHRPVAVLDACVLIKYDLMSVLLSMAVEELFDPRWSHEILEETRRNLVTSLGLDPAKAARRISSMDTAFADAGVVGYEVLTETMTCHPKDRHVLAAAVAAEADYLVTENLRDFPATSTAPHEVEVVTRSSS